MAATKQKPRKRKAPEGPQVIDKLRDALELINDAHTLTGAATHTRAKIARGISAIHFKLESLIETLEDVRDETDFGGIC